MSERGERVKFVNSRVWKLRALLKRVYSLETAMNDTFVEQVQRPTLDELGAWLLEKLTAAEKERDFLQGRRTRPGG